MCSRPETRRYRGAVIGLGAVARRCHLPGFALPPAAERLEIVAAVDPAAPAGAAGGLPVLRCKEELAAAGPLDFVDLCTPTATHVELTLWALERGYHVLCEKPVAVTAAGAERIRRAAERAGRVVAPCHQYRYNPAWRHLVRWVEQGAIGRWHLAEFEVLRLGADPGAGTDPVPWRGRAADGLGGVLLDHGTHLLYQLLDLAGVPYRVHAWAGRLRHRAYEVEDTAHLLLEFPGRLAVGLLTWAGHRRENRLRLIGERGAIEWSGGTLALDRDGTIEAADYSAELEKSAYPRWFAELFGAFAAAMDRADPAPLEDIARVAALLDAAYAAADRAATEGTGPERAGADRAAVGVGAA